MQRIAALVPITTKPSESMTELWSGALRDVADVLSDQRALQAELAHRRIALQRSADAYRVATLRYKAGLSRYLDVLVAEDTLVQLRRAVATLEARAFTLDVSLVAAPWRRIYDHRSARESTLMVSQADIAHPSTGSTSTSLRSRLFLGLGALVVLVAIAVGGWWFLIGSHYVSTDNAYVGRIRRSHHTPH